MYRPTLCTCVQHIDVDKACIQEKKCVFKEVFEESQKLKYVQNPYPTRLNAQPNPTQPSEQSISSLINGLFLDYRPTASIIIIFLVFLHDAGFN